ncbi:hypothetical protein BASA50_011207 [Batrachochytrium salamandrivorans]|uniref:U2A'/phosphoprotein 32 family A C-terminal domain-containing protein n=1 Tax=Batrachochytrium salamandrivorans TaxID=1357716 RepID=A0ABQ8EW23_9FUNG|nr:hypothetical protein BASA50_011207 [Batrachochytrium salamandrivorans]
MPKPPSSIVDYSAPWMKPPSFPTQLIPGNKGLGTPGTHAVPGSKKAPPVTNKALCKTSSTPLRLKPCPSQPSSTTKALISASGTVLCPLLLPRQSEARTPSTPARRVAERQKPQLKASQRPSQSASSTSTSISAIRKNTPKPSINTTHSGNNSHKPTPRSSAASQTRISSTPTSLGRSIAKSAETHRIPKQKCLVTTKPKKRVESTREKVSRRNISSISELTLDEISESLSVMTHVRLDGEALESIDGLNYIPHLTHLYLHNNMLKNIPNVSSYESTLRFLILSKNKLVEITGIRECTQLELLDISDNLIESFDRDAYPISVMYFMMQGNPCASAPDFRLRVIDSIREIREIDQERVTSTERRISRQVFSGIDHLLQESTSEDLLSDTSDTDDDSTSNDSTNDNTGYVRTEKAGHENLDSKCQDYTYSVESNNDLDFQPSLYDAALLRIMDRSRQRQSKMDSDRRYQENDISVSAIQFKEVVEKWSTRLRTEIKKRFELLGVK